MVKFTPGHPVLRVAALGCAASDQSNFICPERSARTCSLPLPVIPRTAGAPSEVTHCARAIAKLQGSKVMSMALATDCETSSVALPCSTDWPLSRASYWAWTRPAEVCAGGPGAVRWIDSSRRSNSSASIGRYFTLPLGHAVIPSGK